MLRVTDAIGTFGFIKTKCSYLLGFLAVGRVDESAVAVGPVLERVEAFGLADEKEAIAFGFVNFLAWRLHI